MHRNCVCVNNRIHILFNLGYIWNGLRKFTFQRPQGVYSNRCNFNYLVYAMWKSSWKGAHWIKKLTYVRLLLMKPESEIATNHPADPWSIPSWIKFVLAKEIISFPRFRHACKTVPVWTDMCRRREVHCSITCWLETRIFFWPLLFSAPLSPESCLA